MENKYIRKLKEIVLDDLLNEDARVYFFGSRARSDFNGTSDVDIAIEPIKKQSRFNIRISLLKEKIAASTIPYKVDLIDLTDVSPEFKSEIMKDAILWKD